MTLASLILDSLSVFTAMLILCAIADRCLARDRGGPRPARAPDEEPEPGRILRVESGTSPGPPRPGDRRSSAPRRVRVAG